MCADISVPSVVSVPTSPLAAPPPELAQGSAPAEAFAFATQMMIAGQFGVAAEAYRQLAEMAEPASLDAEYFEANADAAKGANFSRNGDRAKAVDAFTQAINRFNRTVLPLVDHLEDEEMRHTLRTGVVCSIAGAEMAKYTAQMLEDIATEDFSSAIEAADDMVRDLGEIKSEIGQLAARAIAGGQSESSDQMTAVDGALAATLIGLDALRVYALAENAASVKDWTKALEKFTAAKRLFRDARDAYSASPLLLTQAQIWQTFIDMTVQPAQRRCKKFQEMTDELQRYKAGLIEIARAVGAPDITNTTIVKSTQEISAKFDVQITVINEFEDRTRTALKDLRAAIAAAPADEADRKAVLAAIDKVTAHPKQDAGFFDDFKRFCHDSAAIVGDVAKVAGPVATAWNIFAPFFGLPALPLPGK